MCLYKGGGRQIEKGWKNNDQKQKNGRRERERDPTDVVQHHRKQNFFSCDIYISSSEMYDVYEINCLSFSL